MLNVAQTVAAWLLARKIASVTELDFTVAYCTSVTETAQTVLVTKLQSLRLYLQHAGRLF